MYTHTNFTSGKAGERVTVYQPGPFGPTDVRDGDAVTCGPHYPEPHRFYVGVVVKDGVIVKVKK